MIDFELSITGFQSLERWNMFTQSWLKYYTMMRMIDRTLPRNKLQLVPVLCGFAMSSIWHGTEPGYAFFFTTLACNALAATRTSMHS